MSALGQKRTLPVDCAYYGHGRTYVGTMRQSTTEIARQLSGELASIVGFTSASKNGFGKVSETHEAWFRLEPKVVGGQRQFELFFGITVQHLDSIIQIIPGRERGNLPTFGGPIYRFANLAEVDLHELIVKLDDPSNTIRVIERLQMLWNDYAVPFYDNHTSPAGWRAAVEKCIGSGRIGALQVPTEARLCLTWLWADKGMKSALEYLYKQENHSGRKPPQDYDAALKLSVMLENDAKCLEALKSIIT